MPRIERADKHRRRFPNATICTIALGISFITSVPAMATTCMGRVVVRPVGRITSVDPVRFEIEVFTSSAPSLYVQPTETSIVDDLVSMRLYIDGGPADTPSSGTAFIDLGILEPRSYRYTVALNSPSSPAVSTAGGTFCVEDAACNEAACRCPFWTPQYTIASIGTLGGFAWAQAINDLGQVTGRSVGPKGQHTFLWTDGSMADLGTLSPNDQESSGLNINNYGDVVGYSGPTRAVLWRDGQVIDLGPPGFNASSINDARQIVGWSRVSPNEYHAVLWQDGNTIDLTTTYNVPLYFARDINNSGQITGDNILLEPDGTMVALGSLGGAGTVASAINDLGQVVGRSQRGNGTNWHAFVWDDGLMADLGQTGSYLYSEAVDIND